MTRSARGTLPLFVYGSLVRPRTLDEVLGHRHQGERLRAVLPGWERLDLPAFGYPAIVPRAGARTDGVLLLDLSEADLARLDAYEEVGEGLYERVPVEVQGFGCGPGVQAVQAQTYRAGPALRARYAVA